MTPAGPHPAAGRAAYWRRPASVLLGLLLACLIVAVETMLFQAYAETERVTRVFDRTTNTATVMANVLRESSILAVEVERLPRASGLRPLLLRRAFLQRQLTVLAGLGGSHPTLRGALEEIDATVATIDRRLADRSRLDRESLRGSLTGPVARLERQAKALFDEEEHALYEALAQTVKRREHSQRLLPLLGALALLTAIALAVFIRRAIRADFARAYRALTQEVLERKALQERLAHQASHDALTDLPNRRHFLQALEQVMGAPDTGTVAVLYVDLDGFKAVNDAFGHDAGDELLRHVAQRLAGQVRESDHLARLGGDEFAVLLAVGSEEDAARAAGRLLDAINAPFAHDGHELRVGASIGIAVSDSGARDADELIRQADLAMYAVKADGKSGHRVFDADLRMSARARRELQRDLRRAVENGELTLHYQPIVELATDAVIGLEALVRWQHPVRGLLPPSEFLPLAEETGLAIPLGRWVIREACFAAATWADTAGAPWISVNLSPIELHDPELHATVATALRDSGLAPQRLVLELSERAVLHDNGTRPLEALRQTGVRLALDDFGAGHSALRWLQLLPLDMLKIDRAFAPPLEDGGDAADLIAGIVELAGRLGLTTVAEGIEHPEQVATLAALGCEMGQGFHYSRPVPVAGVADLLAGRPAIAGRGRAHAPVAAA
jgi:diguanylate cyclase (GGDEF)-like protein